MLDRFIVRPFVIWVLLFFILAMAVPSLFIWFRDLITPGLGLIMLGMGMTLTLGDFRRVMQRPTAVAVGVSAQFIIMPFAAFVIARVFGFDPALSAGIIVVGSCPGGTASNVIAYLAEADVALSVTLTSVTTLLAVVLTPMFIWLLAGTYVHVDIGGLFLTIVQVIVGPVLLGVLINRYASKVTRRILPFFPSLSVTMIVLIVACVVALNRALIFRSGAVVIFAVALHNLTGYSLGYWCARGFRLTEKEARTVAIEVGMQNSGLGVALAVQHFTESAVALPSAIFSVWHNLSGPALAGWWRTKKKI
ncbi:MAG TPA: bile acid:sodium symporter family protein [Bacteroidota bacterium]|nr:bile acid:sodium symporter family protein [Bacteroidota bacterium]